MRTAGMVMGIVGGAFAILVSILLLFGSAVFSSSNFWDGMYYPDYDLNSWDEEYDDIFDDSYEYDYDDLLDDNYEYDLDDLLDDDYFAYDDNNDGIYDDVQIFSDSKQAAQTVLGAMFLIPGIIAAVAGVMGLVGGIIVKKKNVLAGVLMIIAAVLSLFSFFNIISMVLFILGGVFALMRERQNAMPPYYPYPQQPYPQQPYPQQPYPQQPYPQQPYPQQPYPQQPYPQQPYPQQPAAPQENPPEDPQA